VSEYGHVRAYLDPLGIEVLPDGGWRQRIEIVFCVDRDRDPLEVFEPVCPIDATTARELVFELLALAERAERPVRRRQ
jgi:hypothetical protein